MKTEHTINALRRHITSGSVLGLIGPELKAKIEAAAIAQRNETGRYALGRSTWASELVDSGWDGASVRHHNVYACIAAPRSAYAGHPQCPTLFEFLFRDFLEAAVGQVTHQQVGSVGRLVVVPATP